MAVVVVAGLLLVLVVQEARGWFELLAPVQLGLSQALVLGFQLKVLLTTAWLEHTHGLLLLG